MQLKYHMVTIEDLVPGNHFLRKLEKTLDLSFVYEETAHLQPNAHKVYLDGQEITLTHKEYELLSFLMANPGQIFSRE